MTENFRPGQIGTLTSETLFFCSYQKINESSLLADENSYYAYYSAQPETIFVVILEDNPLLADKVFSKRYDKYVYGSKVKYWKVLLVDNKSRAMTFYINEGKLKKSFRWQNIEFQPEEEVFESGAVGFGS